MQLTPELLIGLGAFLFAALLVVLFFRARTVRRRVVERPASRGPANLRFTCARCYEQFNHTKRTLGAWEKGTRRFYCNACHGKWRDAQPTPPAKESSTATTGAYGEAGGRSETAPAFGKASTRGAGRFPARAGSAKGCLGAVVLLIAVPVTFILVVVQYA